MAQLAIRGHATRGKEVIEILEMLGGKCTWIHRFDSVKHCYYINSAKELDVFKVDDSYYLDKFTIFTLEEILEKFPYKVGDKVITKHPDDHKGFLIFEIGCMEWSSDNNRVLYKMEADDVLVFSAEELQPYKEENMSIPETMKQITEVAEKLIKIDIPKGYKFKGIDDDKQQVILENIKPQYPKTYKECFRTCFGNKHHIIQVVGLDGLDGNKDLFENFIKLKICRDAYWKIAGDWKPDYNSGIDKFGITSYNNVIIKTNASDNWERHLNKILEFPTKEMRDAFYENFKELINEVKELL